MESPRLPRFERANTIAVMQLTQRDREIVRRVHEHRFLRSSHISALIPGSEQQILRRLQLLYHHGFLARPRIQIDYYHHGGSRKMVYGLGSKGFAIVLQESARKRRAREYQSNSVKRVYLEHELLVADVMVSIELACQKSGVHFLSESDLGNLHRPVRWRVYVNGRRLAAFPDRVFALETKNAAGETERQYFFLEADRGTMPVIRKHLTQTSFYRKLIAYEGTWQQSLHQKRFGFHRFRVVTVTTSAQRVKSLIEACGKLKSGQGLFLFADKTILETPENIFSTAWQRGSGKTAGFLD